MLKRVSRLIAVEVGSSLVCGKNLLVKRFNAPVVLVIALLLLLAVVPSPVWASEVDTTNAISSAKNTILNCYNAAKDAEVAGANISVLVDTLNVAGSLLSQAEFSYTKRDFEAALNFAVQSQNSLNNFIAKANALRETATQQQNQDFLINVVGSIIGTIAVIVAGFAVWLFLKRKYGTTEAHVIESPSV
jgi:hypothetical protein